MHFPDEATRLRMAMRNVAGTVSVITAGSAADRSGLTVTSAVSLSIEPPTMIVTINRGASAWPVIRAHGHFAVNLLASHQQAIADRFAGRNGEKGAARYAGANWTELVTGAPVLADALAVVDCAIEEIIERHSHAIVIGAVKAVQANGGEALLYHHGRYGGFNQT